MTLGHFADVRIIEEVLKNHTSNEISKATGVSLSTIKKLKSGERDILKLNLNDAIKLTDYGRDKKKAIIEVW